MSDRSGGRGCLAVGRGNLEKNTDTDIQNLLISKHHMASPHRKPVGWNLQMMAHFVGFGTAVASFLFLISAPEFGASSAFLATVIIPELEDLNEPKGIQTKVGKMFHILQQSVLLIMLSKRTYLPWLLYLQSSRINLPLGPCVFFWGFNDVICDGEEDSVMLPLSEPQRTLPSMTERLKGNS